MNKKALLLGSIPAIALAAGIFTSKTDTSEGKYEQRLSSHLDAPQALIDGTYEVYKRMKGEFTQEQYTRSYALASSVNKDRATFNWGDHGPDNIGGRTRAIVIDKTDDNHMYAGSVSGGLFESFNGGNTWQKVENFVDNLAISSMCQTADGKFYVATGHQQEITGGSQNAYDTGARGYGIYHSESDGSWTLVEGSQNYNWINEIVCADESNTVWIACNQGLKTYTAGGSLEDVDAFAGSGSCNALSISKDGNVIIGHSVGDGPISVRVSTNGGASFTEVSATGASDEAGKINMSSVGRIEFAISHEKVDGNYRVYASAAASQLRGIWRSPDNGLTWNRIAPAYTGTPGGFSPFTSGGSGQGLYDNIITVVPGAPERIILGGIDCYSWSTTDNWNQISQWFLDPTNPSYVHADNHEFVWNSENKLYIGNDGGIAFSDDATTATPTFHPANRGYNVTQFFATGVSAHGDVIGGTQDNGTLANYHTGTTWREHKEVGGGDGFSAEISFINRNLMFGSVYYSNVFRSSDRGVNSTEFYPIDFENPGDNPSGCGVGRTDGSGCGQFFTNFELWENPNDEASRDTLAFIVTDNYEADDTVVVPSATSQMSIDYITDTDLYFDDTLYYDPSLTGEDTVVIDAITGTDFNLGYREWEYIFGGPSISAGDSLLLIGEGAVLDDTIVVESYELTEHYYGSNPNKPGVIIDMGEDTRVFNVAWDTIYVQDKYQSWFALDIGRNDGVLNGIWMSRNALRFSADSQGWIKVLNAETENSDGEPIGDVATMEFSKDGQYLFIGTWGGDLYRFTGFGDVYSPTGVSETPTMVGDVRVDTIFDYDGNAHVTELELMGSFPGPVTGIASGPIDDPDLLVITLGNFGGSGKVRRSTNATGVSPTFTTLSAFPSVGEGASASGIPCYAVIVDRDDSDVIVVGTEFGVYATEDGGSTWNNVSGDFGNSPVYDMQQNWRTWNEGNFRPGEIYIGTHGRGIWSTDAFLSTPEQNDNLTAEKFVANVKLYPNPVSETGSVEFNLANNEDVLLQIFNLNGQVVNEIKANDRIAGANKIDFDVNALPTGTYILRLSSKSMTETVKFIKK